MKPNEKLSIQFSNMNISSMASNSGIFTGENSQSNWQMSVKSNTGFGKMMGSNNIAVHNVNIVNDNDVMDSDFTQKQDSLNQPVFQG